MIVRIRNREKEKRGKKGERKGEQCCGPTIVSDCDSCACSESDVSLDGGSLFFSLSLSLPSHPHVRSHRLVAQAHFNLTPLSPHQRLRRNGVTTRSWRIFMLVLKRVIYRRDCWSLKVNSRRSCLTLVVGVVKAPTMPPTFALTASVRPMKSGFILRDYEYHLYKCVCILSFPMSELMFLSLKLINLSSEIV